MKKKTKIGKRVVKNDFEYSTYQYLCEMLPKRMVEYETEKLPYSTQHYYVPDFKITTKSGKVIYIETKGNGRAFDGTVRQKMVAVKEQHPDKDIRIVFYSDGKCGPKRKDGSFMRQSDWATKNDFIFAIKFVPKEWFEE